MNESTNDDVQPTLKDLMRAVSDNDENVLRRAFPFTCQLCGAPSRIGHDDKRLIPEFGREAATDDAPSFWCHRTSEKRWHHCKYCNHKVPTFMFSEGIGGTSEPFQQLRCCWECGAGLDVIWQHADYATYQRDALRNAVENRRRRGSTS